MSRPATHADLPDYTRQGEEVARVHLNYAPPNSGFLKAVAALTDAAASNHLSVTNEYGTVTVSRSKTAAELDKALEAAQSEWDAQLDAYNAWLADGIPEGTSQYRISSVLSWARKDATSDDIDWLVQAHKDAKVRDAQK